MAGVRTANPQVDIMRFGQSISASTATKVGRISPVAARAGECPLTETDSGCSAGEARLVFLPHLRHSPRRTSVSGVWKPAARPGSHTRGKPRLLDVGRR